MGSMQRVVYGVCGVITGGLLWGLSGTVLAQQVQPAAPPYTPQEAPATDTAAISEYAGRWRAGTGVGVLINSPDDQAFGLAGNADYFVSEQVSVGPLLQLGFSDDMALFGLSGQGKYWIPAGDRGRVALQAGAGLAHADFQGDDTSWLIPLGVGYEYTLDNGNSLNATALVNFTDLHTGPRGDTDVMPALLFGIQF